MHMLLAPVRVQPHELCIWCVHNLQRRPVGILKNAPSVLANAQAAAEVQTQHVETASAPAAAAPGSGTGPAKLTAEALESLSDPLSLDEIRPRNYSTGSLEEFLARQQSTDSLADKQDQENATSACPTR